VFRVRVVGLGCRVRGYLVLGRVVFEVVRELPQRVGAELVLSAHLHNLGLIHIIVQEEGV
jgi:hypothetical protein